MPRAERHADVPRPTAAEPAPVPSAARFGHRVLAGVALVIVLAALIVAVVRASDDPGEPTAATPAAPSTTTTRAPRPSTPSSTPERPATPPPAGIVATPDDIAVLIDRQRRLPEGYEPADLVDAPVPFTFDHPDPKRSLRREVAAATVELFGAAAVDGLPLRAVSGFRSEASQRDLHSAYVARDGQEAADRYSARPGHSEHQTGLAIDVTSLDGACPAEDCFGTRPEAAWLADHAHEHGFIVRYPAGAEAITGYSYEPWHLRFVGVDLATALHREGLTLDEWYRTHER